VCPFFSLSPPKSLLLLFPPPTKDRAVAQRMKNKGSNVLFPFFLGIFFFSPSPLPRGFLDVVVIELRKIQILFFFLPPLFLCLPSSPSCRFEGADEQKMMTTRTSTGPPSFFFFFFFFLSPVRVFFFVAFLFVQAGRQLEERSEHNQRQDPNRAPFFFLFFFSPSLRDSPFSSQVAQDKAREGTEKKKIRSSIFFFFFSLFPADFSLSLLAAKQREDLRDRLSGWVFFFLPFPLFPFSHRDLRPADRHRPVPHRSAAPGVSFSLSSSFFFLSLPSPFFSNDVVGSRHVGVWAPFFFPFFISFPFLGPLGIIW